MNIDKGIWFWSFMSQYDFIRSRDGWDFDPIVHVSGRVLFVDFWLGDYSSVYGANRYLPSSPMILYVGWLPMFIIEVSTLLLWLVIGIRPALRGKEFLSTLLFILPWVALVFGLGQQFVQSQYASISLYWGFIVLAISAILLLVAFSPSPEARVFRKIGWKKALLAVILVLIVSFPIINAVESQTRVTKLMYVANLTGSGNWTSDVSRISLVAALFNARVAWNRPNYFYCVISVPAASFDLLITLFGAMGYRALSYDSDSGMHWRLLKST